MSFFKSYSAYAGATDAMIQWWNGHNAVGFFLTRGQYPEAGEDVDEFVRSTVAWHLQNAGPMERELPNERCALITERKIPSNGPPAQDYEFNDSDSEHLPAHLFDRKTALGFLRSYAFLIRHPSDLKIAREVGLIPDLESTTPNPSPQITWTTWAIFISHFQSIPDSAVSKRYHFGHLRLGRCSESESLNS